MNGEYAVVEWVEHEILENPITVYNFEVEDYHTYFVGNDAVLVHNSCRADYNFDYRKKFTEYTGKKPEGVVHHGLPVEYKDWFGSKGIDIDSGEYYFDLPPELHGTKAGHGIHTNSSYAGKTWNAAWEEYYQGNPDATAKDIQRYLNKIAEDFRISEYRAVKAGG